MNKAARYSSMVPSFLMVTILAAGLGCSRKPDDAKIMADIQNKFSQDSGLSTKQLNVQASEGVVTLAGNVENQAQRDAAGRQAASEPGVKTVINNLQIGAGSEVADAKPSAVGSAPAPSPAPNAATVPAKKSRKSNNADAMENGSAMSTPTSDSVNTSAGDANNANTSNPPVAENAAAPQPPPPPPPPPSPKKLIIDEGTQIAVRLIDPIDSEKNQTGDTFHATLNAALTSDGETAVPAGVELTGHLVEVKSAGKFQGQSSVIAQLDSLSSGGKTYSLQTDQYKKTGSSRGKNTAEKVGGGAVLGSIIGAIAGGGKGAAIGAAAGAGAGGGVQAATKSQQIKLPSETVLNFTLQAPITVEQAPSPDANRQKLGDSQ